MIIPGPLTIFDFLYEKAAADGREKALFGNSVVPARLFAERSQIGDILPSYYLEFPLSGPPSFDLMTVYGGELPPGVRFAPGAGYGYQPVFDWFSTLPAGHGASCAITMDTGRGETERAGIYLQQHHRTDLVAPFLDTMGEHRRIPSVTGLIGRMRENLPPAYVGLFPGREGAPVRIGGYWDRNFTKAASEDPALLRSCFDRIGFPAYNPSMLHCCAQLLSLVPESDFQFDLYPDGSLGDLFGLSLSFNDVLPRAAAECMENGFGASVMTLLEQWGLTDDRRHRIAGAPAGIAVPMEDRDGSPISLALTIRFNFAKVKFKAGLPVSAKFYLHLSAAKLPRQPRPEREARQQ